MLNGATALHQSVSDGKVQKTWRILQKHPEFVNEKDASGRTPLQIACLNKNRRLIRMLTKHGADIYAHDKDRNLPYKLYIGSSEGHGVLSLQYAVNHEEHKHAATLVQLGIEPFSVQPRENLIWTAVSMLSFPLVKALYRSGASLSECEDVLLWDREEAEEKEISTIFKFLQENKLDGEEEKIEKKRIREYLERYSHKAMIKHVATDDVTNANIWLENAPVSINDLKSHYFIASALDKHATGILCLLIKKYPSILDLYFSHEYLDIYLDVNICLLHWAVKFGHQDVIEEALKHPVDCDALSYMDGEDMTPLMTAAKANQLKAAELLLPRSKIDMQSEDRGRTALHFAVMKGSPEMVQLLLDKGAKQVADKDGKTPLYYANERKEPRIIGLLNILNKCQLLSEIDNLIKQLNALRVGETDSDVSSSPTTSCPMYALRRRASWPGSTVPLKTAYSPPPRLRSASTR